MRALLAVATTSLALAIVPAALAQDLTDPVEEGIVEQSCRSLQGGTAGAPDQVPADAGGEPPPTWPAAPAGLLPREIYLRTATETFNRLYEFAISQRHHLLQDPRRRRSVARASASRLLRRPSGLDLA